MTPAFSHFFLKRRSALSNDSLSLTRIPGKFSNPLDSASGYYGKIDHPTRGTIPGSGSVARRHGLCQARDPLIDLVRGGVLASVIGLGKTVYLPRSYTR